MKYFKKSSAYQSPINAFDGKLWMAIVKLSNPDKEIKPENFTSIDHIIHNARNNYLNEIREQNEREHNKPYLESNENGDIT